MILTKEFKDLLTHNPTLITYLYGKALSKFLDVDEGIFVKVDNRYIGIVHEIRDDGSHGFLIGEPTDSELTEYDISDGTLFWNNND